MNKPRRQTIKMELSKLFVFSVFAIVLVLISEVLAKGHNTLNNVASQQTEDRPNVIIVMTDDQVKKDDFFFRPGIALPISHARILVSDKDSTKEGEPVLYKKGKPVSSGDKSVTFTTNLEPGSVRLHTWYTRYEDKDGQPICGAYYAYLKQK